MKTEPSVIKAILSDLEPTIAKMLEQAKLRHVEKFERKMTAYDEEMTKLHFIYDLVRSLGTYLVPTDKLIYLNAKGSTKGSIVISAIIDRDAIKYDLTTEVIYAGGHNVQCLHYRYITKTDLPKTKSKPEADEIKEKIKILTKREKLNNEIISYQKRILLAEEALKTAGLLSSAQIEKTVLSLPGGQYATTTWNDIVKVGADKNFKNEQDFLEYQIGIKKHLIESWKTTNLIWPAQEIQMLNKAIQSIQKKLLP